MPREGRSAVALRHIAFEDLGLLGPILDAAGWSTSYCDATIDDLGAAAVVEADLLIVLGGPIGVYETESYPFLTDEIALVERRLARERPTLGICLGSQIMARALGSRVYPGATKEIGWGPVELTAAGRSSCLAPLSADNARVLHWHGDTFDLPHGAVRLAFNSHYENQAFAHGAHALALQFHVEADPWRLEQWFVGHTAELAGAGLSVPVLRAQTADVAERARAQACRILAAWLQQIDHASGG
jgi:GMP synthase (glutamine-hydrolysing)